MAKFITAEKSQWREWSIPEYMWSGIDLYLEYGIKPGYFLTAIITNDFINAVSYADGENVKNLPAYANFFYNHVPSTCWGSKEKMEAWMRERQEEQNDK